MYKYKFIIRVIICITFLFSLVCGCGDEVETPQKPIVVAKKIVAKKMPEPEKTGKIAASVDLTQKTLKPGPDSSKTVSDEKVKKALPATPPEKIQPDKKTIADHKPIEVQPGKTEPVETKKAGIIQAQDISKTGGKKKDIKSITSIAITPDKKESTTAAYTYNPEGKVDPFAPLFKDKPAARTVQKKQKAKRIKRVPRTPLEKIDLSQLKLVGIIIVEEEIEDVYGNVTVQKRAMRIQKPLGEM